MKTITASLNIHNTINGRVLTAGYAIVDGVAYATINGKINTGLTARALGSHYGEVGRTVNENTKFNAIDDIEEFFIRTGYTK